MAVSPNEPHQPCRAALQHLITMAGGIVPRKHFFGIRGVHSVPALWNGDFMSFSRLLGGRILNRGGWLAEKSSSAPAVSALTVGMYLSLHPAHCIQRRRPNVLHGAAAQLHLPSSECFAG